MIHKTVHNLKKLPRRVRTRLSHHLVSSAVLVKDLQITEGDVVLELGSPIGFFGVAAIKAVGKPGKVIIAGANEDALERVDYLKRYGSFETTLLADVLLGRALPHQSVDWILLTNVLSSSLNPDHFCLSVTQYAKPGARVVLLDWQSRGGTGAGPLADRRVSQEQAIHLMQSCGMVFERTLATPGYQYALVFRIKK
ncbi:MAG: hypothetical protein QG658_155 [Patescibacteria group bacterium]|nr:hypothetical protein [Patescibacteria group bacterium]